MLIKIYLALGTVFFLWVVICGELVTSLRSLCILLCSTAVSRHILGINVEIKKFVAWNSSFTPFPLFLCFFNGVK